jgi:hypothetical protein
VRCLWFWYQKLLPDVSVLDIVLTVMVLVVAGFFFFLEMYVVVVAVSSELSQNCLGKVILAQTSILLCLPCTETHSKQISKHLSSHAPCRKTLC